MNGNERESGLFQALKPGEREAVQERVWALLSERAARYTMGESTSVTEETAEELLHSLLFCMEKGLAVLGRPAGWLARPGAAEEAVSAGLGAVREKAKAASALLARVQRYPWYGSESRRDAAFRDVPQFFRQYDPEYFAHQIPCLIDYPLCLPSEGEGIDFIAAYLQGLAIESGFCAGFSENRVTGLLRRYFPDFEHVPLGLFEPVFCNALGLSLLGRDPRRLSMPEEDCRALGDAFGDLTEQGLREELQRACSRLCGGGLPEEARAYLGRCAEALAPRMRAVCRTGGLREVFLAF